MHLLLKAADTLVETERRKDSRPRRNRAILALLYHAGLRVSELCQLNLDQYRERRLHNIRRKGENATSELYLSAECRRALDDYLELERPQDDQDGDRPALLLSTRGSGWLSRRRVARILEHIAQEACKHSDRKLKLHPHRLRHTFGWNVMQKTKSESATAKLLGHATGGKYAGWYVGLTREEEEVLLDAISVEGG